MSFLIDTLTEKAVIEICCHENCNMKWAMPSSFVTDRKEDHKLFYCPRGHSQYYAGKSDKEKLQDEIDKLNQRNLNLYQTISEKNHRIEQLGYSIRSQKAAKTKILNRVKNGICPCCNRTFQNLQNHFKTKHPELLTQ